MRGNDQDRKGHDPPQEWREKELVWAESLMRVNFPLGLWKDMLPAQIIKT